MAETTRDQKTSTRGSLAETVQLVKNYARQETLDPLSNALQWILWGLVGAVLLGLSTAFIALGLLRLVQSEWGGTFGGRWMHLLPYLFAVVLCAVVIALAIARINKSPLTKEKR